MKILLCKSTSKIFFCFYEGGNFERKFCKIHAIYIATAKLLSIKMNKNFLHESDFVHWRHLADSKFDFFSKWLASRFTYHGCTLYLTFTRAKGFCLCLPKRFLSINLEKMKLTALQKISSSLVFRRGFHTANNRAMFTEIFDKRSQNITLHLLDKNVFSQLLHFVTCYLDFCRKAGGFCSEPINWRSNETALNKSHVIQVKLKLFLVVLFRQAQFLTCFRSQLMHAFALFSVVFELFVTVVFPRNDQELFLTLFRTTVANCPRCFGTSTQDGTTSTKKRSFTFFVADEPAFYLWLSYFLRLACFADQSPWFGERFVLAQWLKRSHILILCSEFFVLSVIIILRVYCSWVLGLLWNSLWGSILKCKNPRFSPSKKHIFASVLMLKQYFEKRLFQNS